MGRKMDVELLPPISTSVKQQPGAEDPKVQVKPDASSQAAQGTGDTKDPSRIPGQQLSQDRRSSSNSNLPGLDRNPRATSLDQKVPGDGRKPGDPSPVSDRRQDRAAQLGFGQDSRPMRPSPAAQQDRPGGLSPAGRQPGYEQDSRGAQYQQGQRRSPAVSSSNNSSSAMMDRNLRVMATQGGRSTPGGQQGVRAPSPMDRNSRSQVQGGGGAPPSLMSINFRGSSKASPSQDKPDTFRAGQASKRPYGSDVQSEPLAKRPTPGDAGRQASWAAQRGWGEEQDSYDGGAGRGRGSGARNMPPGSSPSAQDTHAQQKSLFPCFDQSSGKPPLGGGGRGQGVMDNRGGTRGAGMSGRGSDMGRGRGGVNEHQPFNRGRGNYGDQQLGRGRGNYGDQQLGRGRGNYGDEQLGRGRGVLGEQQQRGRGRGAQFGGGLSERGFERGSMSQSRGEAMDTFGGNETSYGRGSSLREEQYGSLGRGQQAGSRGRGGEPYSSRGRGEPYSSRGRGESFSSQGRGSTGQGRLDTQGYGRTPEGFGSDQPSMARGQPSMARGQPGAKERAAEQTTYGRGQSMGRGADAGYGRTEQDASFGRGQSYAGRGGAAMGHGGASVGYGRGQAGQGRDSELGSAPGRGARVESDYYSQNDYGAGGRYQDPSVGGSRAYGDYPSPQGRGQTQQGRGGVGQPVGREESAKGRGTSLLGQGRGQESASAGRGSGGIYSYSEPVTSQQGVAYAVEEEYDDYYGYYDQSRRAQDQYESYESRSYGSGQDRNTLQQQQRQAGGSYEYGSSRRSASQQNPDLYSSSAAQAPGSSSYSKAQPGGANYTAQDMDLEGDEPVAYYAASQDTRSSYSSYSSTTAARGAPAGATAATRGTQDTQRGAAFASQSYGGAFPTSSGPGVAPTIPSPSAIAKAAQDVPDDLLREIGSRVELLKQQIAGDVSKACSNPAQPAAFSTPPSQPASSHMPAFTSGMAAQSSSTAQAGSTTNTTAQQQQQQQQWQAYYQQQGNYPYSSYQSYY